MTDWNKRYQKGDTPWEKGAPAPPLLELLGKLGTKIFGSGPVLVPGCGTGHDVRALASTGLKVQGIDSAEAAISRAQSFPLTAQETYHLADFLDPKWRAGKSFSAIWEHTCYCAIHPSKRPDYAAACAGLIPPGGHLIGVFFLTPHGKSLENIGPPFAASITELDARFAPWFQRISAWVPESAYPGREGQEWLAVYKRN